MSNHDPTRLKRAAIYGPKTIYGPDRKLFYGSFFFFKFFFKILIYGPKLIYSLDRKLIYGPKNFYFRISLERRFFYLWSVKYIWSADSIFSGVSIPCRTLNDHNFSTDSGIDLRFVLF